MSTSRTFLPLMLILSGVTASAHGFFPRNLAKMIERHERLMRELWEDLEDATPFEESDKTAKSKSNDFAIFDTDAVKLPDISLEKSKEGRSLKIQVKGISAKKDEIQGLADERHGYVQFTFPYQTSTVTLKLYPNGIAVAGEKKITQEKKDEKGAVLGSSSYVGYNAYSKSFPYVVDLATLEPEYKDGTLTLTLGARETKRAIHIK
jgi:hypothetical protein